MKTVIATAAAPAAIGPYSQAIQVGNMLFTSGQIPIDPATSQFVEGGIKEQTTQVFANLKAVLAEAGYTFDDVVKTTVFLADMSLFVPMNEVYASQFSGFSAVLYFNSRNCGTAAPYNGYDKFGFVSGTVGCCRERVTQRGVGGN